MFILGVSFLGILTKLLIAVDVIVCVMLIFVVLLQRPKSEGLGAAFGGDTASNIFGAQTTNVLTNLTRWLAGIFMGLTLALAILYSKNDDTRTATQVYLENARKKADEDKARVQAEEKAKAASAATKGAEPTTTSDPAKPAPNAEAIKATVEKLIKDGAIENSGTPPVAPAANPPVPATPTPDSKPEPAKPETTAPKPEPTASPAPAPAPEPAKPEAPKAPEPADAPAVPEPAKPAGN